MSIRSQWCEYNKEERKHIKKRDGDKCVICKNKGALQIMHIFVNRSHGGRGIRTNGVLGCIKCHRILDNPIGEIENAKSKELLEFCKLSNECSKTIETAFRVLNLSARAYNRILKVARTIADLDGVEEIRVCDIQEAIQYRSLDKKFEV